MTDPSPHDDEGEGDALPAALRPLAFLVGTWLGVGVGGYPTIASFRYAQELTIRPLPGRPVLTHSARSWLLDEDGTRIRPAAAEVGWWRATAEGAVELLLTHPTGISETYVGRPEPGRIELVTDVGGGRPPPGGRPPTTAVEVTGGKRLYGLVDGALMYAVDLAAVGQPLQPHLSARLEQQPPAAAPNT